MTDLIAGLGPTQYSSEREQCLAVAPEVRFFCENMLVTGYDAKADVGLWTHLGTHSDDFSLWEELVYVCLPGDEGLLWTVGFTRPPVVRRPAGPNLSYRCIEPFLRWEVRFDAVGVRTPYPETLKGPAREGRRERFSLNLDLEMVGPLWDAHESASSHAGAGKMSEQVWASDHYEQLYRFTGELRLEDRTIPLNGTGLRDHSRGARGGEKLAQFGGHALIGVLYDSDKAFGLQRILTPDGRTALDTGYVVVDGQFHHAEVIEIPLLGESLHITGEQMRLRLRSALGELVIEGELMKASFASAYMPGGMITGVDLAMPKPFIFFQGHARWVWDGEVGYGLTERSRYFRRQPA